MIARGLRALVVATLAVALCGCAPESPNPPFTASGAPTAPTVQGNSNAVTATALGAVTEQGEANSIAPR